MHRTRTSWSLTCLCLVAGTVLAAPAGAAFPGDNGRIAFTRSDGDLEIFSVMPDGTGEKQLTNDAVNETNPEWSPDGTRIAYLRTPYPGDPQPGPGEIVVADADGTNPTTVSTEAALGLGLAWTPDGRVVYTYGVVTDIGDPRRGLYSVPADGSSPPQQIVSGLHFGPAVAPDGRLAFTSYSCTCATNPQVAGAPAGGGSSYMLTSSDTEAAGGPEWAPDSARIMFARSNGALWVMSGSGGNEQQLRPITWSNTSAWAWSPDGTRYAYTLNGSLHTANLDGSDDVTIGPASGALDWARGACSDIPVGRAVAKGCFEEVEGQPGDYRTDQEAWVGGFAIRPKPGGTLLLHTQQSAPGLAVEGAGAEVLFDGKATSMPVASIPISAGSAEIDLSGATGSVIAALWKLPLTGKLNVEWTEGGKGAKIAGAVKLVDGLLKGTVGEIVGDDTEAEFTASLSNGEGLKLQTAEVKLPPLAMTLPVGGYAGLPGGGATKLGFAGGTFKYTLINNKPQFYVTAGLTFPFGSPSRLLSVSPTFVIYDGALSGFGLKVGGLNLQLGSTGLWVQSLEGVGLWNPRFGLDLGAEATLGPQPPGSTNPLLELEGHLRMLDLVSTCPGSWSELTLKANIPILERLELGKGEIVGAACMLPGWGDSWVLTGTFEIALTLGAGADVVEGGIGADGTLSGAINGNGAHLGFDGSVHLPAPVAVGGPSPQLADLTLPGKGVVSTTGYAFCVNWGFLKAGYGSQWNQPAALFFGCDLAPWATPAASVAAARHLLTIPDGLPFAGIAAIAADGAPRVRVSGPGGVNVETAGKLVRRKDVVIYPAPAMNRTYVFIRRPEAGRWRVTALKGDKVTRVEFARGLAKPRVRARVRRRGKRYRLVYNIARQPGQSVQFVERTKSGGVHLLGKPTKRRRGTIRFKPVIARERKRTIEADVTQSKLPRATLVVGRFKAPAAN